MAAALALTLLAALLSPAGTAERARRSAGEAAAVEINQNVPEITHTEMSQAEIDAAAQAEAEAAGVPAWRDLWYSSLEALRREPTINNTQEDILVQLGGVAFLHCPVRNLGERGVSWVRRRDWHIISSGVFMYTNDERFQVLHSEGSDDWILQIKYVQKRDNGTYECQVSTGSGTLSRLVHLHIVVPEAFILGADEYHVDAGSTINLVCIIEKSPVPPQYVFWYHNARMINYDAARGVTVATAPGARTQSALAIRSAAPAHSGNYSCRAANTEPAHIYVYVSEGSDKMAATLSRNASNTLSYWLVLLITCSYAVLWSHNTL
ncbi:zwei Ig domain protein zig-8-like [Nymphalis io]|uniref:zwei Ig domain protein zig-8-like n=1 Tax=Inachis io TaxID=171585 RepID=UPI0021672E4A|nr:zwei Ig domain protein zig-8-like [Nymphalis io]XP_050352289.1 zwei Ig domain protein zig-8-like [Nymphalis io]XP_050352290.1 zwei Ig domain protein zig-8-like [Nymphalis io]